MSRLSEIEAAWNGFEECLSGIIAVDIDNELGRAFRELRDLVRGSLAYTVRGGWCGVVTLNGAPAKWTVGTLMNGGRPVGVRRIAADDLGRKRVSATGVVLEDVEGEVGGWLTQDHAAYCRWRKTGELPTQRVIFDDGVK